MAEVRRHAETVSLSLKLIRQLASGVTSLKEELEHVEVILEKIIHTMDLHGASVFGFNAVALDKEEWNGLYIELTALLVRIKEVLGEESNGPN